MQAVVHVCDPGQPGKTQDFTCNITTLMQGMRYFHDVLQKATQNRISPVEISVHCDVAVFEWLLGYCCGKTTRDHITVDRALPLLIASNFLQMDSLVSDCLAYMAAHLLQVAQHQHERGGPGGDLAALPLDLLSRLAKLVPERSLEQLAAVRSAEGCASHMPLVNRLYKYKLEGCLRDLKTTLARCAVCQCLFSLADRAKLECQGPPPPHPPPGVGGAARGKASEGVAGRGVGAQTHTPTQRRPGGSNTSVHIPDAAWRLQDHLATLRAQNIPWRGIYWHVWGLVHVVYCHSCMQYLPAAALHRCTYHPQAPVFAAAPHFGAPGTSAGSGSANGSRGGVEGSSTSGPAHGTSAHGGPRPAATGFYPCCGVAAIRGIDPRVSAATGCCTRDHRVLPAGQPPGAALPSGLTPALLDTLQSCEGLFTNPGVLLLREEDGSVVAAAAGATGAAAGGGGVAAVAAAGREGHVEEGASSSHGHTGSSRRIRKLASYDSYDSNVTDFLRAGSEGRLIPPALQALLSSTAAAAAVAARNDASGGGGSGRVMKSSSGSGIAGLVGSGSLGPAAAATAAALGYRLNTLPSADQPGTSGPGPPPSTQSPLPSQAPLPVSSSLSSSQQQPPSRHHQQHQQQHVRPVSSPQQRHAGVGSDRPSGTSTPLQPSLSVTGNPLVMDARSLAAEVVRRLSQGGSISGTSGALESAAPAAHPSLHPPAAAAQAPTTGPSLCPMGPNVMDNLCNPAMGVGNSFEQEVECGQQQHLQQGHGQQQQGHGQQQQGHHQQRHQARRSFTSIAALQQEAFDQALLAEAEEMAAVRGSEAASGEGDWNSGGRSGAGSPLSLYSGGAGSGTPVALSPPPHTPQQAGTSRHPHQLASPQPPQPPPHSPHARLLSSVQSSPHSPYQQQPTRPHSPLRPAAATARGALVSRGVRSAGSIPPAASAAAVPSSPAAAAPPSQPPTSPPFPYRSHRSTSQGALGLSSPNPNESQSGVRSEPPPDYAMQMTGAGGPVASCPQFLASSTISGGAANAAAANAAAGSSTAGGRQWAGPQLALSALSAEAVLLAAGRISRADSQLRASAPLPHHGSSSSSGRRGAAEQQQVGYPADTSSSSYEQQQLYPSPRSQPSPMQSPAADAVGPGNASQPSRHTSSPYQQQQHHHPQHQKHHPYTPNHNPSQHHHHPRHHYHQQHRQHVRSRQPQPQSETAGQLASEHGLRTSYQRPSSRPTPGTCGSSGPSGPSRRDSALPPRPAHRVGGSSTSGGKLRRRLSEAGGQRNGGGGDGGAGDASLPGSDANVSWPVGCSLDGLEAGGAGGGESRAAGRSSCAASPQTGMPAAVGGSSSGRGGVRWSQLSVVSASSDGIGCDGVGAGNPLQRSVQAALLQQRQKRQAEPPQSQQQHQQHVWEASTTLPQQHQQRSRQRSAGRARGQAPSGQAAAAEVRRSSGSIGSEATDAPAAAATDPTRQALIEQYKTQRVLSPRPINVQMIAISELPPGGRGAPVGGVLPGEGPGGAVRGGARGEGSASMSNMGGSYSSAMQWLRHGYRGSDEGGVSGLASAGRSLSSSAAPAAMSDVGDTSMFSAALDEADDGCGGSGYGAANSTAGGLAMSPANRGRKLRMELLYEDDNYRMDLLVQHLLACRPSTRGSLGNKERETRPHRGRTSAAHNRQNTTRGGTGDKQVGSRPTSATAAGPPQQQRQRAQSVSNLQRLISVYGAPPGVSHPRGGSGASGVPHTARTYSATLEGDVAFNPGWHDGGSFGRAGEGERGCTWGRTGSGLGDSQAGGSGPREAHGGRRQELRPLSAPRMRRYA